MLTNFSRFARWFLIWPFLIENTGFFFGPLRQGGLRERTLTPHTRSTLMIVAVGPSFNDL